MVVALYKTKKALKASVGRAFRYQETSMFGNEVTGAGTYTVVGPGAYERKWYAQVTVDDAVVVVKVK